MSRGSKCNPKTEQRWRRCIREWRSSGLSVRAFCRRHGLHESNFYFWRRALDQGRAEVFTPVRLAAEPEQAPTASVFEVVVAQGRTVRVAAGFDAADLRRLLAVLEEQLPC